MKIKISNILIPRESGDNGGTKASNCLIPYTMHFLAFNTQDLNPLSYFK